MSYGRTGRRRHELLQNFLAPEAPSDQIGADADVAAIEKYSPEWHPPPMFQALLKSQESAQDHFQRTSGTNNAVKTAFKPPAKNIWERPMPLSRLKNMKHKWYQRNVTAALPPLPEPEYKELLDLATGRTQIPDNVSRRPRASVDPGAEDIEQASSLIVNGPRPGWRFKDFVKGRPHVLTPRFLRRLLGRSILAQSPLVKAQTGSKGNVKFQWDNGQASTQIQRQTIPRPRDTKQVELLFS